jgi:plasmid stabilization system protein ParE
VTYFLSTEAEQELIEAIAFYTEQASVTVASAFLAEFTRAARLLDSNPGLGTSTLRGRRIFPMRRFPYSLVYRDADDGVRIAAIAHQRRRPGYWRGRE